MPNPIQALTLADFSILLDAWKPRRRITQVHVHCTDRPRHADYRGLPSIEAMRRYHQSIGMKDIAQHLTIAPDGVLWTGRPFDAVPASVRGHNGTSTAGPFMIEMIGLFEAGVDQLAGDQKKSAYAVICRVLRKFGLDHSAVMFHREFPNTGKTCPGMGLEPDHFREDIKTELRQSALALHDVALPDELRAPSLSREAFAFADEDDETTDWQVPEDPQALSAQLLLAAQIATEDAAGRGSVNTRDVGIEYRSLIGHVINTSQGILSAQGLMQNTAADLDRLINDHLLPAIHNGEVKHIVFYAHGGLVSERAALCHAQTMLPWWKSHGVYPVFFAWESNAFQAIYQQPRGALRSRDLGDFWDKGMEIATQTAAREIWSSIKANARRCSESMTKYGQPGGLYLFAQKLLAIRDQLKGRVSLHAIGHSTGPILLARFMPLLTSRGMTFATLSYLAPAIRIDDFQAEVESLILNQVINRLTVYTMNQRAEKDDDVVWLYRKSLLYFVRNACEDRTGGRILGLQEDLLEDPGMVSCFGLTNKRSLSNQNPAKNIRIEFSQHKDQQPQNPSTQAMEHGAFDNDKATMTSVLATIIGDDQPALAGGRYFPTAAEFRQCRELAASERAAWINERSVSDDICECCGRAVHDKPSPFDLDYVDEDDQEGSVVDTAAEPYADRQTGGARQAVCVGIDDYPDAPLAGCVNDCRDWAASLKRAGFRVQTLVNTRATRTAMLGALRKLISGARPGDELVYVYAGHGTQVPDLDGDEVDRFDEALVPIDYAKGNLLIDDDLYEECRKVGLTGKVTLTIITDCCHSGTNTRAAPLRFRREGDRRNRLLVLNSDALEAYRVTRSRTRAVPPSNHARDEDDALPGIVSFAACQDREVALESNGHGDFTRHALSVLDDALAQGASNQAFLRKVVEAFGLRREQNPRMQEPAPGLKRRKFLGGKP